MADKDEKCICTCHKMDEANIKEAVDNGANSIGKVVRHFGIQKLKCAMCARRLIEYVSGLLPKKSDK